IPLAETFLYMCMGNLNDQLVKIIFALFFCGILGMFYFTVRRFSDRTYALLFTFLLASVPQFNAYATNAYLEVPLAYYYFASVLFLLRWFEDSSDVASLVMSAFMVAMAGWTKNEGLLYCVINSLMVCLFVVSDRRNFSLKRLLYPIFYGSVIFIALFPWNLAKGIWHISNDEINLANINPANLIKQAGKLMPIFYELQKQLFGPKKWNILWPAFFLVLAIHHKKLFTRTQKYLTSSVVLAVGGYIIFYMISYVDVVFFASKTWSRFLIHFLPVVMLLMAMLLKEDRISSYSKRRQGEGGQ
ncbi:MAG: glycosyltransferase family 39 protein, partial [Candidatus Omnitrophica bacterium]|nr:glycosyltransferase family 39 protein [Candidatus Omnitrophota bacterium]